MARKIRKLINWAFPMLLRRKAVTIKPALVSTKDYGCLRMGKTHIDKSVMEVITVGHKR
jgi:hypothetical protein